MNTPVVTAGRMRLSRDSTKDSRDHTIATCRSGFGASDADDTECLRDSDRKGKQMQR